MGFEPLKRILPRSMANSPSRRVIEIARIFSAWDAILRERWGEERASYVFPVSFHEGVLKAATSSSSAKQMLELEKERLKQDANHRLGALAIHAIVIVWRP